MKKILSLTIIIASLLTLFSAVPVNAALDNTQIYAQYDFEEGVAGFANSGNHEFSTVPGANGTKGAMGVKVKAKQGDWRINMHHDDSLIGKDIKVSYWFRYDADKTPDVKIKKAVTGMVLWFPGVTSDGTQAATRWKVVTKEYDVADIVSGEWQYFEWSVSNWDGALDGNLDGKKPYFDPVGAKEYGRVAITPRFLDASGGNIENALEGAFTPLNWEIDDIRFEVTDSDATDVPVVSNLNVATTNLTNDVAKVTFDYAPTADAVESKAIVTVEKQLQDGKTAILKQDFCVADENGAYSYEFPVTEDLLGETLVYNVLPYEKLEGTENYVQGAKQTFVAATPVKAEEVVTTGDLTFNEMMEMVQTTISIENNHVDGEAMNVFVLIAMYDAKGSLAGCATEKITVEAGQSVTNKRIATDFGIDYVRSEVVSAKAFFWTGTSVDDMVANPYAETLSAEY